MTVNLEEGWAPRRLLYESDEPVVELVRRERAPLTKPFFYQDLFVCPPKRYRTDIPGSRKKYEKFIRRRYDPYPPGARGLPRRRR